MRLCDKRREELRAGVLELLRHAAELQSRIGRVQLSSGISVEGAAREYDDLIDRADQLLEALRGARAEALGTAPGADRPVETPPA